MTRNALTWLEPGEPTPLRIAANEPGLAGMRYDGLVARTPRDLPTAVDLLAGPEGRAEAFRAVLPRRAAVARTAAVWVHTGRLAPERAEAVVQPHERVQGAIPVHRQRLWPGDVARVSGVPVTTPLRTAMDLACFVPEVTALPGIRALVQHGVRLEELRTALRGRRLPLQRALGLLQRLEADGGRGR